MCYVRVHKSSLCFLGDQRAQYQKHMLTDHQLLARCCQCRLTSRISPFCMFPWQRAKKYCVIRRVLRRLLQFGEYWTHVLLSTWVHGKSAVPLLSSSFITVNWFCCYIYVGSGECGSWHQGEVTWLAKHWFLKELEWWTVIRKFIKGSGEERGFLNMTEVGFEPTPVRTAAWTQRLRPLGHPAILIRNIN